MWKSMCGVLVPYTYLFSPHRNTQNYDNSEFLIGIGEMCVPMPTHCTITRFGFHARWIDGIKRGLFSNHAPLGQTKLRVG